jgi:hypothetical protein
MRQPDEVAKYLRDRFERDYPEWARGLGTWPMRIPLKPPSFAQRSADPIACHAWAALWSGYTGPGRIEYTSSRFPTGTHPMPRTLVIDRPSDLASVHASTRQTWHQCEQRLKDLQCRFPEARFERIVRRLTDLDEDNYQPLVITVTWLRTHPTSGLLLRQLPIEGIDTKWLARHTTLVLALLGDQEPLLDDTAREAKDGPASARIRLHERLGLRTPPDLIQVAVLDQDLRTRLGGMRHFAASVDDLNAWSVQPHTVVILENKETGYAITEDHQGTVVLHGHGFSVVNYARITWVRSAQVLLYWGDIDAAGLQFVSDLRSLGLTVQTILTDIPTLEKYQHLATDGAPPQRTGLPHLTPREQALYAHLAEYAATHGNWLLLEQERIPWSDAYPVLAETIANGHREESQFYSAEPEPQASPVPHNEQHW